MSTHAMAVALGANAGDRTAALEGAVRALRGMGSVRAVSPLFETPAQELPAGAEAGDRAPYLNAVVRLETDLAPEALLAGCLACEAALGRDRARERRHGARALDMDLLLCDRQVRDGVFLRLPHPRMATRSFVLAPLAAAWPDAPRPQGGPWPRRGPGGAADVRVVADAGWADGVLGGADVPAPAADLRGERDRRRALGRPPLYLFGELGSTADVLRQLAAAGAPHGTAVVAERQRAGRGRHGRAWWAPPYHSLLMSVLLRDGGALGGLLPLFVGLAVVESVEAAGGGRLLLKWPNDVIARDGRKAAGVLVERTGAGAALVGIGINMAPPGVGAPPEVAAHAASVGEEGDVPGRDILLRHLSARLVTLAGEAHERGTGVLLERWRARAPMLGRPVTVQVVGGGGPLSGLARAVAADGALIVRQADGSDRPVHAGEVTLSPAWGEVAVSGEHGS